MVPSASGVCENWEQGRSRQSEHVVDLPPPMLLRIRAVLSGSCVRRPPGPSGEPIEVILGIANHPEHAAQMLAVAGRRDAGPHPCLGSHRAVPVPPEPAPSSSGRSAFGRRPRRPCEWLVRSPRAPPRSRAGGSPDTSAVVPRTGSSRSPVPGDPLIPPALPRVGAPWPAVTSLIPSGWLEQSPAASHRRPLHAAAPLPLGPGR